MALKTVMKTVWAYEERKSSKGRCVESTRCREGLAFGVKDWGMPAHYRCHTLVLGT